MGMLTIKGYDKDLDTGVIYGWDLTTAYEESDCYLFIFEQRIGNEEPVTCRIERKKKIVGGNGGYMCDVFQVRGSWNGTYFVEPKHIQHSVKLYELVETTISHYIP
jgi:hypothetical protein